MSKTYGTWKAFLIERLAEQEDMSGYLSAVMEEYQTHGNASVIQVSLQNVVEAKGGISELAKKTDIDPEVLSDVLTSTEAPRIDTLRTVLNALGCCLSIVPLENVDVHIEIAADTSIVPVIYVNDTPETIHYPRQEVFAVVENKSSLATKELSDLFKTSDSNTLVSDLIQSDIPGYNVISNPEIPQVATDRIIDMQTLS